MILGKKIRKEVMEKERFFNEYLEIEEDVKETGRVFLEYNYKMNNPRRDPDDRFRILLYPENSPGKLVFSCSGNYMENFYKGMAEQFKDYCIALENVKESEKEYRKTWKELTRMHGGPSLIKVDLSKEFAEEQAGNNILTILDERDISIRELAIALDRDYSGVHKLVNRESLDTTQLGTLLEIAEYLNVDIYDLYK